MNIFRFKKSLGQHFLKDQTILEDICSLKNIRGKSIIEIGPGHGYLTECILKKDPYELLAIEKDKTLEPYLKKIKNNYPKKFKILYKDALGLNLSKLLKKKIILIANLPYNIATTLIINWLSYIIFFETIIVMVQKEVAERLIAKVSSKAYGRLSVLVQLHANVKKIMEIEPEKFYPKPKVFSSVLLLSPKKKFDFNYEKLDSILKLSFSHRRKTIKNNLKKEIKNAEEKIVENNINPNIRPQDISPNDYIKLSQIF